MPTPAKSHGCTWHWLSQQDLSEIAGLVAAEEHFGDATHHHDLNALQAAVARETVRDTRTGVVLRKPSGTLIAYAWVRLPEQGEPPNRLHLHGGCHPAWRDEGVQDTLLRWQVDRSVEWYRAHGEGRGPLELVMLASGSNLFLAETLPASGFRAQKWYHALQRSLGERTFAASVPGITLEQFGPGWSEAVRRLYNSAVSHPADVLDADAWRWGLESADIRDDWSWVALDGDAPVGWALNCETNLAGDRAGWTEYLGAQPAWRNRGLFTALLARSNEAFRAAGLAIAGIGVETDSDQGARPYEALGYTSIDSMVWYVSHPATDRIEAAKTDEQQMGRT